jgi:tripartite-type tricarboxylate transporter receptor subunit TctC
MLPLHWNFRAICAGLVLCLAATAACAQSYPNKPVRVVMPFPIGGPSDITGRAVAQKLGEQMSANFVPDNRVGAGGNLGLALAAKAAPDGYTLLVTSSAIAVSPSLYAKLDYDAAKDFAPVARLAQIPNVLIVHPGVQAKTLREFIALARANPGKLNYGSGGAGTTNHLANELLMSLEKINLVHVPYKGASVAVFSLIGGEVDEVVVAVASALTQIRAGKVRALAVLSEHRTAALPDVPTAKEAGVDNFVMPIWFGMFAPAATPRDILARLHREVAKAMAAPDFRERLTTAGVDPWLGTPDELAKLVSSETARYAAIIKRAGLRPE